MWGKPQLWWDKNKTTLHAHAVQQRRTISIYTLCFIHTWCWVVETMKDKNPMAAPSTRHNTLIYRASRFFLMTYNTTYQQCALPQLWRIYSYLTCFHATFNVLYTISIWHATDILHIGLINTISRVQYHGNGNEKTKVCIKVNRLITEQHVLHITALQIIWHMTKLANCQFLIAHKITASSNRMQIHWYHQYCIQQCTTDTMMHIIIISSSFYLFSKMQQYSWKQKTLHCYGAFTIR